MIEIVPSVLAADFSRLGPQVTEALDCGVKRIHFDIMDGHFVPNISMGPATVAALSPLAHRRGAIVEVHLMIAEPERYLKRFIEAGGNLVLVHVETCPHLHRTLHLIRGLKAAAGVVLNPGTPLSLLEEVFPFIDQALVMTVSPGFGGQQFIPTMLDKIVRLRRLLDERGLTELPIEVDGGIHAGTISQVEAAGATLAVAGSAVFNAHGTVADNIALLRSACQSSG
jgi:ribulose-phosphate 3-epimerase